MSQYIRLQKEIIRLTFYLSMLMSISLLLLGILEKNFWPLAGFLLGMVVSILNFRLLAIDVERSLNLDVRRSIGFMRSRYLIRYFITFLVLFTTMRISLKCFVSALTGLMLIKMVIFSKYMLANYFKSFGEVLKKPKMSKKRGRE